MSSSEEEAEENDDVFEMEPMPPPPRGRSGAGGGGPPLRERGQPAFDPSKRRGSVIVLGGKQSSVSVAAEVAATVKRMHAASESNDINQMQAALNAAGSVAAMAGPGDPTTVELQTMAMKLASRISGDESLRETSALRRSRPIREEIRRLWDLMEMESTRLAEKAGLNAAGAAERRPEVTRDGYREMHMRISRALCDPSEGFADERKALALADKDWAGDISRFSGTAHIVVWLAAVREKFREASARAVYTHGFAALFKRYDADGSGELDQEEFEQAVRSDLGVDETQLSTKELKQLFQAVDADGSGEVDANEFTSWLFGSDQGEAKPLRLVRSKFRAASERVTSDLGWKVVFDRYDDDNSGELDLQEFTNAVRTECGLDEEAVSDDEIKELFGVIDTDQGGGIDSGELMELLEADLDQASITFGAFYSSIFELAEIWAYDEDEESPAEIENNYVTFLRAVFKATAVPRDHVKHFSDAELETLDVFEDAAKTRPNFELRPLGSVNTLVQVDGTINLTGDRPTGKGPKTLRNHIGASELETKTDLELQPEPEAEPETQEDTELARVSRPVQVVLPTTDAQTPVGATETVVGSIEPNEDAERITGSGQGHLGGRTRGNVLWGTLSPKLFALHDPVPSPSAPGSELAPAAVRRKGCWVLPWQVRFARKPPGGAGALGAKRGDFERTTVGKPKVRVTRSKFLEQYNHTVAAHETPCDYRRHGPLKKPQYGVSSQEYWAARRALLIESGVRAATSAQVASSKAVRRQQQMATVKGAARHARPSASLGHREQRDRTTQFGGRSTVEVTAAAIARLEKERIENVVSPFSPKAWDFASTDYEKPVEDSELSRHRPKTAPEGIERVYEQNVAHPTEHMSPGTAYTSDNRNVAPGRKRAASRAQSARAASSQSPRPSIFSPASPMVEKTPRQVQSARDRRKRAATSKSGVDANSPLSVATGRRGLDPMDIARGLTRPTAMPRTPLFLPLSPRKFDELANRPSDIELRTAASPIDDRSDLQVTPIVPHGEVASPTQSTTPCSPHPPSNDRSRIRGSLSSPRAPISPGADLRCYASAGSEFIALPV